MELAETDKGEDHESNCRWIKILIWDRDDG